MPPGISQLQHPCILGEPGWQFRVAKAVFAAGQVLWSLPPPAGPGPCGESPAPNYCLGCGTSVVSYLTHSLYHDKRLGTSSVLPGKQEKHSTALPAATTEPCLQVPSWLPPAAIQLPTSF